MSQRKLIEKVSLQIARPIECRRQCDCVKRSIVQCQIPGTDPHFQRSNPPRAWHRCCRVMDRPSLDNERRRARCRDAHDAVAECRHDLAIQSVLDFRHFALRSLFDRRYRVEVWPAACHQRPRPRPGQGTPSAATGAMPGSPHTEPKGDFIRTGRNASTAGADAQTSRLAARSGRSDHRPDRR